MNEYFNHKDINISASQLRGGTALLALKVTKGLLKRRGGKERRQACKTMVEIMTYGNTHVKMSKTVISTPTFQSLHFSTMLRLHLMHGKVFSPHTPTFL